MSERRRVVVTGLGAVTPLGNCARATWEAMIAGRSGVGPITLFDSAQFAVRFAGEVKGFVPPPTIDAKDARRMDRNVQFAVSAAGEAIADSGLVITPENAEDIGCVCGTAVGGIKTLLDGQAILDARGPDRVGPFVLQNLIPDAASGQIAITYGLKGHNMAVVSACATGGHALGEAAEAIRRGDAVAMVAGGTEAAIVPVVLAGFTNMRALALDNDDPIRASKPFDARRQGFVMSEGAAMMILEDLDHAIARGARVLAEFVGYGSTNDAFHLAAPADNGEGAARAIARALKRACIRPEEVDYINAHGTGTPLNDKYETAAIKSVFQSAANNLVVSSTKSMTGHMMGAAGAVEAFVCVRAIVDGIIPPTINLEVPDPDCDLDYAPLVARRREVRVAMSNSLGLGGHNSCVVFRRFAA
ncbi:MAG: beta-ketoacyl-[acyl-carrier-protein] synthase II [Chloroflexota bacterium]|nr:MAG: beta-ketoacyl-[acyl-carrier-protein] synthase II [Chloroflexota bacterium]